VLGTSLEIRWTEPSAIWGRRGWAGRGRSERIEAAVLEEIRRLDLIFSTYREDSELSRWQAAGSPTGNEAPEGGSGATLLPISNELAEVLEQAAAWRERTGGAFDPSCAQSTGPLWEVIRGETGPLARKLTPKPITLDAIAKGYIVDRAAFAAAAAAGPDASVLVNIGGDIRHVGCGPVTVAVADPFTRADNTPPVERVRIAGQGIATSGPFLRGRREGGKWRSHIIDPRSGESVDHIASATVVAPSAEDADALATAFSVLSPEESLAVARGAPGVECLLIDRDGRRHESPGWTALRLDADTSPRPVLVQSRGPLLNRRELLARLATVGGALFASVPFVRLRTRPFSEEARAIPWDERFELALTFQIGDPRAGLGLRRPYVATYVETADGSAVRTISLWSQRAQWIREMRRWYRSEGLRRAAHGGNLIDSATQPTRAPGTYTVVWDGRDDQGQLVEQGEYFICLESVRQSSSSFFTQQAFTFESTPFQATIPDYAGFSGIQLDFRQRQ
jgi:thiamine biosynthesis lipoprotein ApbE